MTSDPLRWVPPRRDLNPAPDGPYVLDVVITRLPRFGIVPAFFAVIVLLGSGVLRPSFDLAWMFAVVAIALVVWRVMEVRLEVGRAEVVIVNFVRTIRIPRETAVVEELPSEPGYLTIRDRDGRSINVGAAPTWRMNVAEIRARTILAIEGI